MAEQPDDNQHGRFAYRYRNGTALTRSIRAFDKRKQDFKPGNYTLYPYAPSQTLKGCEKRRKPGAHPQESTGKLPYRKRKVYVSVRRTYAY